MLQLILLLPLLSVFGQQTDQEIFQQLKKIHNLDEASPDPNPTASENLTPEDLAPEDRVERYYEVTQENEILNLSQAIVEDILDIINNRPVVDREDSGAIEIDKIKIFLYTRRENNPTEMTFKNLRKVNPRREAKIIIHGWLENSTTSHYIHMKEAYLEKGDYNVFIVDWSKYSFMGTGVTFRKVPEIAKVVERFVTKLIKDRGYNENLMHIIGHSVGAHIAGIVGQNVQENNGGRKVYRITGLDAQGPLFELYPVALPKSKRLSADDAQFVDAIHTNGGTFSFGFTASYGTADYFVNGGYYQFGCTPFHEKKTNVFTADQISSLVFCSHRRSVALWNESIQSAEFMAKKCRNIAAYITFICSGTGVMGEMAQSNSSGNYYLLTNRSPPYARG